LKKIITFLREDKPPKKITAREKKLSDEKYYFKIITEQCCAQNCLKNWKFCDVQEYVSRFAPFNQEQLRMPTFKKT